MKITRIVAIAIMVGAVTVGAGSAQIKQTHPAEFPSSSYKGKQYVDSKGCVFIRAGIDGNVSWVPRVSRDRKVVCGFTPTVGAGIAAAAPVRKADKPVQITIAPEAPAPKPAVRTAAPKLQRVAKPVVVRQTAPKPVVIKNPVVEVASAPAPAPKKRATRTVTTTRQVVTACPGASPISQRYLRGDGKNAVRCGPQAAQIVGGNYRTTAAGSQVTTTYAAETSTAIDDHTRIVPKHVAIRRLNTTNVAVPKGYRSVWEDGRLNPRRAEQNLSGRGQMLLIWTNTVPRRLVNQATGRDLTASVPLVYPYLDEATQRRELGEVTIVQRDGKLVKRIVRHRHATAAKRKPVYSSRSAPKTQVAPAPQARTAVKPLPAVGGKRFVHIGLFSTKAKAQRAAQHLAGMGMRAQMSNVRHKGKTYLSVQAGPFKGANATQSAVSQLRSIGYTGAKARN